MPKARSIQCSGAWIEGQRRAWTDTGVTVNFARRNGAGMLCARFPERRLTPSLESSPTAVLGLDNVPLELPIAGAATRALAAFLDYIVVALVMVVWAIVCFVLGMYGPKLGTWAWVLLLIGAFLIEYGYFAASETLRG